MSNKGRAAMIDLKVVIQNYPNSLKNRIQLAAILHDLYPTEKREVNLALAVYDCGIVNRISKMKTLELSQKRVFIKLLEDEWGIREDYALQGILLWTLAYSVTVENDYSKPVIGVPINTEIIESDDKPVETVIGNIADYDIKILNDGTAIISKYRGIEEFDMVVPNIIDGHRIVEIGKEAYINCRSMNSVTIMSGIKTISESAFAGCSGLTEVFLPNSVLSLGGYAFCNCLKLKTIELSNKLKAIGVGCFKYSDLESIVLPDSLQEIRERAFLYCDRLNNVKFGSGLRVVGGFAFDSCKSLKNVKLNEGLKKINNGAFSGCYSLEKVLLPTTLTEIVDDPNFRVFESNSGLTVYCYNGTYGFEYAKKHGFKVKNAKKYAI